MSTAFREKEHKPVKNTRSIVAVRELLNSSQTPPPNYGKRCKACSLVEICQPELLGNRIGVRGMWRGCFLEINLKIQMNFILNVRITI